MYKQKRDTEKITSEKEINILRSLGIESYEIDYLLFMKQKEEASLKWE